MLSAVEAEVAAQPRALARLIREKTAEAPAGSLFVGAGDSFVAASVASRLSAWKHVALDPYDLCASPELARGRSVYFVSVSGRTSSNSAAARAVRGFARMTTAVTADEESPLAKSTDSLMPIPYKFVPKVPATLSFSLSLFILLQLACGPVECDFAAMHSRARGSESKVLYSSGGATYFLGNGPSFPVCSYSASKVHEILGGPALAVMLEEFSHAGLFALDDRDAINVHGAFDPNGLGTRLTQSLGRAGFRATGIPPAGTNPAEQIFHLVFLGQLAVLKEAKARGLSRPYFTNARKKLSVSDSMIYRAP